MFVPSPREDRKSPERREEQAGRLLAFDCEFWSRGCRWLAGVDEAGRGPLAGPVVAAAVIFSPETVLLEVNDSKKLTPRRREALYHLILSHALTVGIGSVDSATIDRLNILAAALEAMRQAVRRLSPQPDAILVDGLHPIPGILEPQHTFIGGDARSHSIAAASVVAKVTRDWIMEEYDRVFPGYAFAQHKGYGTKLHLQALKRWGPCPIHRRSFSPVNRAMGRG